MAEQKTPGSGGPGYRYSGGSGRSGSSGNSGSPRDPKKFNLGEWIPIIVLFCIPSGVTQIIGVIWALSKIAKMFSQSEKEKMKQDVKKAADRVSRDVKNAAQQVRQEAQKEAGKRESQTTAQSKAAQGEYHYSYTPKQKATKPEKKIKSGKGLIIGGSILAGTFGLSVLAVLSEFIGSLSMGYFFSDELAALLTCLLFAAGGAAMIFAGVSGRRRRERYLNYLAYIGANREVNLAHMAASFGVSVQKLCKDLRKMLADGILPTGYLDLAEGKLYLTEMGYQAPEPEPEPAPMTEEQEDDILRQIRQVNDDIPDETMSAKIDRIEEITGKILAYQKANPDKAGQLRSFLNYYLPTTLKILRAYAQLDAQGIEGENISAAKARIEGMMDQVVAGFEKQLDKLFQDDAMDIASDVQVLENMLKKDGLSGNDNMTMTL